MGKYIWNNPFLLLRFTVLLRSSPVSCANVVNDMTTLAITESLLPVMSFSPRFLPLSEKGLVFHEM
jgi:hypothetical protein